PRDFKSRPSDAAVIPSPCDDTTPPVTNTYLTCLLLTPSPPFAAVTAYGIWIIRERGDGLRPGPDRLRDRAAGLDAAPAGSGTAFHALPEPVARRRAALAHVGAEAGNLMGEVGAPQHHVAGRVAHLRAVEHEPRVEQVGGRAPLLEAVGHRLDARLMAVRGRRDRQREPFPRPRGRQMLAHGCSSWSGGDGLLPDMIFPTP